jgi:hypothetical protein
MPNQDKQPQRDQWQSDGYRQDEYEQPGDSDHATGEHRQPAQHAASALRQQPIHPAPG